MFLEFRNLAKASKTRNKKILSWKDFDPQSFDAKDLF